MIRVNDLYPAIQGEGKHTGTPMVIVRLQGCQVGCPWCDTKETWLNEEGNRRPSLSDVVGTNPRWTNISPTDLAIEARKAGPAIRWIMLTGGEPAEQDLTDLVTEFHRQGFNVNLETSGTGEGHLGTGIDWVCVSPKVNMPGGRAIRLDVLSEADEIKQVIGKQSDIQALDELLASAVLKPSCEISLQPLSTNSKATDLCMNACLERGWRLSIQTHKVINAR